MNNERHCAFCDKPEGFDPREEGGYYFSLCNDHHAMAERYIGEDSGHLNALEDVLALRSRVSTLEGLLRRVEWGSCDGCRVYDTREPGDFEQGHCLFCGEYAPQWSGEDGDVMVTPPVHGRGCSLAAALKGETTP